MSSLPPATDLASFRAQLDIVGLAGKLTEVANAGGRGAKIRCPFHEEGSASCYLYPEDNHFHCFGCGAHGSVMDLVAQLRGVSFGEAIEWCAETSGIAAPARDPREAARAAVQPLRWQADAVLTGVDTVLADDPQLTADELNKIARLNRGTVINAIEFGVGPPAGRSNFLVRLAQQNGGQHAYVDVTRLPAAGQ